MSEMYFCVYLLFILAYASALKECQLHELGYKKILSAIFMILFVLNNNLLLSYSRLTL